ncbi:hypothetical protein QJS66_06610 [Kocuria rhizophila]|nr:hypothetical protein QJS66_06610 [Kocuria rhizophila]
MGRAGHPAAVLTVLLLPIPSVSRCGRHRGAGLRGVFTVLEAGSMGRALAALMIALLTLLPGGAPSSGPGCCWGTEGGRPSCWGSPLSRSPRWARGPWCGDPLRGAIRLRPGVSSRPAASCRPTEPPRTPSGNATCAPPRRTSTSTWCGGEVEASPEDWGGGTAWAWPTLGQRCSRRARRQTRTGRSPCTGAILRRARAASGR